ncbi:uncharacterized protein [Magallana gigas]|uniref:uncharacterized protein isoform X2 n=1 Tax=Magallana gigas TaxID=29159 RepID=UPI0033415AA1
MKMLTCIHGKRLMKITDRQWIWYCIVGYIGNINILFSLGHLLNYCVIPVQERWGITIFELSFVSSKTALSSKTPTSGTLYMKIYNCLK